MMMPVFLAVILLGSVPDARLKVRCLIPPEAIGAQEPARRAVLLTREATHIVVATASSERIWIDERPEGPAGYHIIFRIDEVLKGKRPAEPLLIDGFIVNEDDFNPGTVPYAHARITGGRTCFANAYRPGAQYLLFLRPHGERFTPYWAPRAPVNEQVRPAGDEWISWVRGILATSGNERVRK